MSNLLILPGTVWQVPLMEKAKRMGHTVHLVNPVKVDGVYQVADFFLESDIFDVETVIAYCKENNIAAVLSDECDIATDLVSRLNEAIGANAIGDTLAELFTSKFAMREFCEKHDFNPIPHKLCKSAQDAHDFLDNVAAKAIIKPLDSNASHGVFTIENHQDIDTYFPETLSFSRNSKTVVIESYIDGTEFTVDGIMTKAGHKTLAISEKHHYGFNLNIADQLYFTQTNKNFDYDQLRAVNDQMINATGLPYGLTHVEYKFSNGTFYLIEMAARGGGNLISAVIAPFMSGVDTYEALINSSLDKNYQTDITADLDNQKASVLKFFDLPVSDGIVEDIEGEDYLKNEPCIKNYALRFGIGDHISAPVNDSARVGYYIACAESEAELQEVMANVESTLNVKVIED